MPDEQTTQVEHTIAPAEPISQPAPSQPTNQPSPEPSEPKGFDIRQVAYDLGYTQDELAGYRDDTQLAQALFHIADEYKQVVPLAQLGQKVAPYADKLDAFEKWVAEQQAEKSAEPEASAQFQWPSPEYDPAWEQLSEQDDPLGSNRAKLQRYKQWEQQTLRQFARAPHELVSKAVEPVLSEREKALREYVDQKVVEARTAWEQQQAEQAAKTEEQAWLRENMKDLYALDGKGQVIYGRDRQPVLTEYGSKVFQHYNWARGLSGPEGKPLSVREAAELAMLRAPKPSSNEQTPAPTQPAVPPEEQRFLDTVSTAERHPERRDQDDTAPSDQFPDAHDAFWNEARRAAAQAGVPI